MSYRLRSREVNVQTKTAKRKYKKKVIERPIIEPLDDDSTRTDSTIDIKLLDSASGLNTTFNISND